MAKATLEFDLDKPDDRSAHRRAVVADDLAFALSDVMEVVREFDRMFTTVSPEVMRKRFFEILSDRNIDIDNLFS